MQKIQYQKKRTQSNLEFSDFERYIDGKKVALFVISNRNGLEVSFTNYGQRLVSLLTPDSYGNLKDIVLGYSNLEEYIQDKQYFGAIIGRYANRIKRAKFSIDDQKYSLDANDNKNHIHGGSTGFHNSIWEVTRYNDNSIEFSRFFKNLEDGYPANIYVSTSYELTDQDELVIEYLVTTDQKTHLNLTHHSYFNLSGHLSNPIFDHFIKINANYYTPIDQDKIPKGKITTVEQTPFDFTKFKQLNHLNIDDDQIKIARGYDHNFILNANKKNTLTLAASVFEPVSGRVLKVFTDKPGIQFYSGSLIAKNLRGKHNITYGPNSGLCLETQYFPNTPNQPDFPSSLVSPDKGYRTKTVYKFSVK